MNPDKSGPRPQLFLLLFILSASVAWLLLSHTGSRFIPSRNPIPGETVEPTDGSTSQAAGSVSSTEDAKADKMKNLSEAQIKEMKMKKMLPGNKDVKEKKTADKNSGFTEMFRSAFDKMRQALSMSKKLRSEKEKSTDEELKSTYDELAKWSKTKEFGFLFGKVPPAKEWEVDTTGTGTAFLTGKNWQKDSQIVFASIRKDKTKDYSKDIRDHWGVGKELTDILSKRLALKNVNLSDIKDKSLNSQKLLKKKVSGTMAATNAGFNGSLFFFQTGTHFVEAIEISKVSTFRSLEETLERMFNHLIIMPIRKPKQLVASRQAPAAGGSERYSDPDRDSDPVYVKRNYARTKTVEKKKPWELEERNTTTLNEEGQGEGLAALENIIETFKDFSFTPCKVCGGKGRCTNPLCNGGFITCDICKEHPPAKCRKCKGTGLKRVEDSYTRLETWDYCERCFGTGKKICRNNCRGGKLKCEICGGKGLCPECKGRGLLRK